MSQRFTSASSNTPTLFLIVSLVLAGAMSAAAAAEELLSRSPERGGIGLDLQHDYSFDRTASQRQACTKRTSQQAGRAAFHHCHR